MTRSNFYFGNLYAIAATQHTARHTAQASELMVKEAGNNEIKTDCEK